MTDPVDTVPTPVDTAGVSAATVAVEDTFEAFSARGFRHTPLWQVGEVTQQVVDLFQQGLVAADLVEDALEALRVAGPDGDLWALGATSRRWYRKLPGGRWHLSRPPARPEELTDPAAAAVADALRLLGVDPDSVDADKPDEPEASATDGAAGSLLDEIIDGYGD